MIALAPGQAALATPDAGDLLSLPVQLLNPPADAAFSPGSPSIVLPHVIGHDYILRSGGGNQYPEQFETGIKRYPEELYRLALHDLGL